MDIELLSNMVKELILDHDSVELPGFGTFVAIRMPASFSDKGYTVNPPYRKLNFVYGDHPSDGLIFDLYASSNSIEKSDAESIIRRFLAELKDILNQEKMLVFPSLGVVKAVRNGMCLFVPDADLDISPEYYGLAPISLKSAVKVSNSRPIVMSVPSTQQPEPEPVEVEVVPEQPVETPGTSRKRKKHRRHVAGGMIFEDKKGFRWWLVSVILLIAIVAVLATFLALSYFAPDLIDRFLYSPEELQIINTDLEDLLLN